VGEVRRASPIIRSGFVTNPDGVKLFWCSTGPANPVGSVICCNGVGVSTFFWKYLVDHFSDRFQVVVWDYRGHGRSDRPDDPYAWDLSIAASARDLGAVAEATGAQRAVLVGHSMGCQVILERYRQAPEQVLGLIPMLGSAGRVLETFYDNPRSEYVVRAMAAVARAVGPRFSSALRPLLDSPLAWPAARRFRLVDPHYTRREDLLPYVKHLAGLDLRLFLSMTLEAHAHDAFPALESIAVPVLIVAAERDTFTPIRLSYQMAATIPGADILVLADASHAALIEQPETINHRITRFLRDRVMPDLDPRSAP